MSHIDTSPAALRKLAEHRQSLGYKDDAYSMLLAVAAEKEAQTEVAALVEHHFPGKRLIDVFRFAVGMAQMAEKEAQPYMHEDELPADISDADYAAWYAKSWVLDGAGVRVGPVFAAVVAPADVPLPGHPEPHTHRWTALELEAIKQHREAYAKAAVAAERERCAKICDSVHADTGECPELALHCATRIRANQKGTV